MAQATLVLNVPQLVTLEASTSNLRKVTVPAGTRYLEYSSLSPWYLELASQGTADGAAGTPGAQQRFDAGTGSKRAPGSGAGRDVKQAADAIFVAGSVVSQQIWLTAVSLGV